MTNMGKESSKRVGVCKRITDSLCLLCNRNWHTLSINYLPSKRKEIVPLILDPPEIMWFSSILNYLPCPIIIFLKINYSRMTDIELCTVSETQCEFNLYRFKGKSMCLIRLSPWYAGRFCGQTANGSQLRTLQLGRSQLLLQPLHFIL